MKDFLLDKNISKEIAKIIPLIENKLKSIEEREKPATLWLIITSGDQILYSFKKGRPKELKFLDFSLPRAIKLRLGVPHISPFIQAAFENICFVLENQLLKQELNGLKLCCETISHTLPHVVTVHDSNMRIIKANQAACKFLGKPAEEIIGRKCYEVFHGTKVPPERCPALSILQGITKQKEIEFELDNLGKTIQINVSALTNGKGNVKGYVHIVTDLTEKKKLEEKLIRAQKLEALGTLAGGIAHDFNNLLTPILGFAEIALLRTEDQQLKDYLQQIISCAQRAKELVSQIRTFSHQGSLNRKPLLIESLVKEGIKLIKAVLPSNIKIKTRIKPCGYIMGNPTEIQQILLNLASNAFYAMKDSGGTLSIALEPKKVEHQKYACLTFADTGTGIPPEIMSRIFDPYFTTKPPKEGTGLGLAVVNGIVKNSGGYIEVKSKPQKGTTFELYFPLLKDKSSALTKSSQKIDAGQGERILILDDDEQNLKTLEEGLQLAGYETIACKNCEEALLRFFREPESYQLFLTDLLLPGTRGDRVAGLIKETRPDLPVILLTGFNERISTDKVIDAVLFKPVSLEELTKTIKELLTKKDAHLS